MIYEFILKNYEKGEPILIDEIPGSSKDVIRHELKRLTDDKKIVRAFSGVYYLPYKNILDEDGDLNFYKYLDKKYFKKNNKDIGFYTGLNLANRYGFTTQNPSVFEICSNVASTKQRKINTYGYKLIIYKTPVEINNKNFKTLQFLELMMTVKKYSEIKGVEYQKKIREFIDINQINFNEVKKYIKYYPASIYKNLYEGGIMNELV